MTCPSFNSIDRNIANCSVNLNTYIYVIGSGEIFLISRIFAFSGFWDLFFSTRIYVTGHLGIKFFNVYLRFWGDRLKFILRKYTLPGMKRLKIHAGHTQNVEQ